ncbi:MAG TPA: glycerol kinase GlpK [Anaerolineae bacterium]|nr:glycerol kinase GlpK [Anaerolineae bacterium]
MNVVLGIDHGTTRTKVLALDMEMRIVAEAAAELPQVYPQPGWVEQRPADILNTTTQAIGACIAALPQNATIAGVGLANQGETVLVWDKNTGAPLYNAIVWQDRRTTEQCNALMQEGWGNFVHERTGLYLDSYFSATKVGWILDHVAEGHERAETGDLYLGTTDTWLLWNFSRQQLHITDATTASRTLFYNLHTLVWDEELLDLFQVPRTMLPNVQQCAGYAGDIFLPGWDAPVPIMGLVVDQQAALFGHACLTPGLVKVTYGTGTFVLMNIGDRPKLSEHALLTTVAWVLPDSTAYALDGGIYTTGAAVQWLVEGLGILESAEQSAAMAQSVADNGGVFVVPAFAGLAAPYWDSNARGLMIGLTRASTRAHIVRATLEGIAYRVRDVLTAMERDAGIPFRILRVDGGPTRNSFLMQFQSDILNVPIQVAASSETTARGAGQMAGLASGWWSLNDIAQSWSAAATYEPTMNHEQREALYARWQHAVQRAREWL